MKSLILLGLLAFVAVTLADDDDDAMALVSSPVPLLLSFKFGNTRN